MGGKPTVTATAANAMTAEELDRFMGGRRVGRLGTVRRDGDAHVTPMWYLWEGGKVYIILGTTRLHTRNLERVPRATFCVDEDPRLERGYAAGAQGAVCRGPVELTADPEVKRMVYEKIAKVYGLADDPNYIAARDGEERVVAVLTPENWLTWDFTKT